MREIPLTRGLVALVDDEDYEAVSAHKWFAHKGKTTFYASRCESGKNIMMHRVILVAPRGLHVDHISGDGLDNRRQNVRLATPAQNARNTRRPTSNTSGYKGVHRRKGMWRARIEAAGKKISLGYFSSPEMAHRAYCAAAEKYHGEFARTS